MAHEYRTQEVRLTRFRPSVVVIALLWLTLLFGAWWAVVTVLGLRDSWSREGLLTASRPPSFLLKQFISGLDERDPDLEFLDKLVQKVIKTDLSQEMRSRVIPGWIDLMEELRSRDLVAPEQWTAFVEKFLVEAEQSAQPMYAVGHLLRYEKTSVLAPEQLSRLIRVALETKGMTAKRVQQFLLEAYSAGRIDDKDWEAMVKRSYPVRFVVREKARLGTSLPVRFDLEMEWTAARKAYDFEGRLESLQVDGAAVENAESPGWRGESFYEVSNDRKFYLPLVGVSGKELTDGQHTIRAHVRFHVTPKEGQEFPRLEWTLEEEKTFTVVPETTETVEVATGPPGEIDPSDFMNDPRVDVWRMKERNGATFRFGCRYQPRALSYDVYWKSQGEEVRLGSFFMRAETKDAGSARRVRARKDVPTNIDVATVDIVLRPNRRLAEKEADCYTIHGEEIVLEGIPVRTVAPPEWYTRRFEH